MITHFKTLNKILMSLSPWDLTGHIVFDFSLQRPRRHSYLIATQARQLNGSFKSRTSNTDCAYNATKKERKSSYMTAIQPEEDFNQSLTPTNVPSQQSDAIYSLSTPSKTSFKKFVLEQDSSSVNLHTRVEDDFRKIPISEWGSPSLYKNLVMLSLSFVLMFTSFRSIQNLQSSLNSIGRLGYISLTCLHFSMFSTCLWAPVLVHRLTSKWAIVVAFFSYLIWVPANFWPHFFTLVPSSICVGFGQSLAWSAQVSYMRSLVENPSALIEDCTKTSLHSSPSCRITSRKLTFNAFFLGVFQTSHIWGNILSSFLLTGYVIPLDSFTMRLNRFKLGTDLATCGIYDAVDTNLSSNLFLPMTLVTGPILKLMMAYLALAVAGFVLGMLLLGKVKHSPSEAMDSLSAKRNIEMLINRKKFSYLLPLLIFNGFEQAFITADYTKSYVTCSLGVEYIGYNMLTLGLTNLVFSFLIGILLKWIPREVLLGLACILHLSLMVVLLVWIPDHTLIPVYFLISAFWGICNAIWQSQCNCLVSLCCKEEEQETAFQNVRLLQAFGASMAFLLGVFVGASVKLYVMITLLTAAVLSYVVLEYNVRRIEEPLAVASIDLKETEGRNVFRQSDLN